jgi:hypothetical protein
MLYATLNYGLKAIASSRISNVFLSYILAAVRTVELDPILEADFETTGGMNSNRVEIL